LPIIKNAVRVESYKKAILLEVLQIVVIDWDEERENVSVVLRESGERQLVFRPGKSGVTESLSFRAEDSSSAIKVSSGATYMPRLRDRQ
jgi:hypothetical protein